MHALMLPRVMITSDIKNDEAQILTLYRRISRKKLRASLIRMAEDLVQLTEGGQGDSL